MENTVNGGTWAQETYLSRSRKAGKRARQLRKLGYRVTVSSMGCQIVHGEIVGNMSLVDIRPGDNADTVGLPGIE